MVEFCVSNNNIIKAFNINDSINMSMHIEHLKRENVSKGSYYSGNYSGMAIPYGMANPTKMLFIGTNGNQHFDIKNACCIDLINNTTSYGDESDATVDNGDEGAPSTINGKLQIELDPIAKKFRILNIGTTSYNVEFTVIIIGYDEIETNGNRIQTVVNNTIKTINNDIISANLLDIGLIAKKISYGTTNINFPFNPTKVLILCPQSTSGTHLCPEYTDFYDYFPSVSGKFVTSSNLSFAVNAHFNQQDSRRTHYAESISITNTSSSSSTIRLAWIAYAMLPDPNVLDGH